MRSPFGLKEKRKILQRATKSCQSLLDLRGLHIAGIPKEIFAKPLVEKLIVLELSFNGLQSLPSCICQLVSLEELYLGHNNLKILPKEIGDLPALTRLDLVHNGLQEVPFCISRLRTLEWVNLAGNLVEVLPPWLLLLPNLQHLYLVRNLIENIPRDCYLQGIDCIRRYFRLPCTRDASDRNCHTNLRLLSPQRKCFTRPKLRSNTLDRPLLLSESEPDVGFKKLVCEQTSPSSRCSPIEDDSMISASLPVETLPGKYVEQHQNIVSNLEKAHQNELCLVKQQKSKLLHKQELRKKNIDSLRKKKEQCKPAPFPYTRRGLDFSLDLESLNRRRPKCLTTSEYGTCSSITESIGVREHSFLNRKDSLLSFQSSTSLDDAFNNNLPANLRQRKLSSNSGSSCLSEVSENDCYINDSDLESVIDRRRHISLEDICVIIPEENITGHLQSEFHLEVLEDMSFAPTLKSREVLASEVIEMTPHGAEFFKDDPAIISFPFDVKVGRYDVVTCLCSNTGFGQRTSWEKMNPSDYKAFTSHVEIRAYHFSLFAIVVTKGYPEARKTIKAGIGGYLHIPEVSGIEILFPDTSLLHDIEASVKVLYADHPYDVDHSDPEALALATPVVQLGPHGCVFNLHSADSVTVRLPLPDGKEILERYGDRQLTFWCSSTTDGEDLQWQQFYPRFFHIDNDDNALCSVYFSVEHFSFVRVLWNIIDTILWEAKLGASSVIPLFQFSVSFQALMSEVSENGLRFGLCIACYRFGKPLEDIGNFPTVVGKCIAPRLLHTGRLQIRLESDHFDTDTSIGVKDLVAVENFTGHPFVIQFGCRFKGEPPYGNFGNVFVEELSKSGENKPVFSFLLNRPRDADDADSCLDWDVQLIKELTNLLSINAETDMGDEVWHEVAKQLGYTPREISNFSINDKPMSAVITDYKRRGGTPRQFIAALYKTGSPGNVVKQKMNNRTGSTRIVEEDTSGHYLNKQAAIMKITFLTEEWTQSTKGSCSTFMRQMAIELSRLENVEIGILIPSASPEDKEDAQKYNIKVFEPEKIPGYEPVYCLPFPPKGFSTDFIIGHGIEPGCHGQVLKYKLGCKWVHVVLRNAEEIAMLQKTPGAISKGQKQHETEVELCKKADMVITVGSKLNETFNSALHHCKKDHIFNLIPGVFNEFFGEQKQYQDSRTFEILVFGRGNTEDFELKGLHVAAKAVAHLNKYEPSYILKVVGAPEGEQEKLAERLEGLGISLRQLRVRSFYKERRKLAELFSEVDLVLMPSGTEAFGLTALEALSAGVPILITHNSGLAEALEEVPFGCRCIVDQADDWADQIKQARKHLKTGLVEASTLRDNYKDKYCWMDQCAAFVMKLRALHSGHAEEKQQESQGKRHSAQKRVADPAKDPDQSASKTDFSSVSGKQLKGRAEEMQQESQGKRHSPRKRGAECVEEIDQQPQGKRHSPQKRGAGFTDLSGDPDQFASNADSSYVSGKRHKEGVVSNDDLQTLGKAIGVKWDRLACRLPGITEDDIEEIEDSHRTLSQRGFHMLKLWKTNNGEAADYKTLHDALVHNMVQRKDLAEKYCFE